VIHLLPRNPRSQPLHLPDTGSMDPTERKRRFRAAYAAAVAAEAAELGGWYPTALCDGFNSDGQPLHWETYSHPDGREVDVFGGRYCSDPELQALLTARAAVEDSEEEPRPWFWRAMDLVRRVLRAWGRRRHGWPSPRHEVVQLIPMSATTATTSVGCSGNASGEAGGGQLSAARNRSS